MAVALAAEWTLLHVLARRASGRSLPAALAWTCAGAGATVMLSGYFTGGELALPLAAALAGAAAASLVLSGPLGVTGWLGPGIIGLFGVLVVGRFFATLSTLHAVLLFGAPLLGWLPELPYLCRLRPSLRGLIRLLLIAALVAAVAVRAWQKEAEPSWVHSSPPLPGGRLIEVRGFDSDNEPDNGSGRRSARTPFTLPRSL